MLMFQDPFATEPKHPLDVLRDRLLPCRSIAEARDSLLGAQARARGTQRAAGAASDLVLRATLDDALKVMWAFNEVVAEGLPARVESRLPFKRSKIKQALLTLYAASGDPATREAIQRLYRPKEADLYLSGEFHEGMLRHLKSLSEFWPDSDAKVREYVLLFDEQETDPQRRAEHIRTNDTLRKALLFFAERSKAAEAEFAQYAAEARRFRVS